MDRRKVLLGLPAVVLASVARASIATEHQFAVPTRVDQIGRILVPVRINGSAPRRFVLDTGADRSALSPRVAAALGLEAGPPLTVHGVTGVGEAPSVLVRTLRVGPRLLEDQVIPVLDTPMMEDTDGILGVSSWTEERFVVDFERDRVRVERSPGTHALRAAIVRIPATRVFGGLLAVNAIVGSVRAKAVIDTGAERTIANLAFRDALLGRRFRDHNRDKDLESPVFGATLEIAKADSVLSPEVRIENTRLRGVRLFFSPLHVFKVWNLQDRPALVLGMDILGSLAQLVIDFGEREIRLAAH